MPEDRTHLRPGFSSGLTRRNLFEELGDTGLERWGGEVDDDWLQAFRGRRRWITIREMKDNDAVIGAILFAVDMLIRQVKWDVAAGEAGGDPQPEDDEARDFVSSALVDMSLTWESTIAEILSFLPFGFSYHELVYKRRRGSSRDPSSRSRYDDGRIGWRKMAPRAQESLERWVFDDDGGVNAMVQRPPTDWTERTIPIEKALLFRTTSAKGSPEGRSVLRSAYRPWYFKRRIEEIEAIGIERDLAGLPVLYLDAETIHDPANASLEAEYRRILRDVRRNEQEGLLLPLSYDENGNKRVEFELLSSGGSRQFDTDKVVTRKSQEIAITVLADFILLGHEKVGSYSLSSDKTELFSVAIGTFLDEIASVMNRHAIPRLLLLNGMKGTARMTHGDIETPDLKQLGEWIKNLAGAGAELFPDDELENRLRQLSNLPPKPEQDDDQ